MGFPMLERDPTCMTLWDWNPHGCIGLVDLAYKGYRRGAGMINAMQIMATGVCGYQHSTW